MRNTPATGTLRGGQAAAADSEISTDAAIALAQASCRLQDRDQDWLTAGCRFAGTLRPGDAYWFPGSCFGTPEDWHQHMHRVIVVWGPRLDTTSDVFGRELIRFWISEPATGREGSATFGPRGVVRTELDGPYWVPAAGSLSLADEAALAHHPKCECDTCRPDLGARHHPDCQCTACQPGKWAPVDAVATAQVGTDTQHNHKLLPFGRRLPRGQCPRCDQLHDGAPARTWGGRLVRRCSTCGGRVGPGYLAGFCEACQRDRHDCAKSGCGPVCTAFQW